MVLLYGGTHSMRGMPVMSPVIYPLAKQGVYWSIQGEGHLRGIQMAFIRLAGCSVGCPQCDTDYRLHGRLAVDDVVAAVLEVTPSVRDPWVWITGGEPADHDLYPLIRALRGYRFSVAVATSGHKRIIPPVDWLSVSPHDPSKWVQRFGSELKVVPGLNGATFEDFAQVPSDFMFRWVQPLSLDGIEQNLGECMEIIRANPDWGLSRQEHIQLGLP